MIEIFDPKKKAAPGLVLATEEDYFGILMNMLEQARRRVDIMQFAFVTGGGAALYYKSLPFQVMVALKNLKKNHGPKIQIRVFLEGHRDTAESNAFTADHLRRGGIDVRLGPTHAKVVIVDGRYTLIGSSNMTDQSLTKNFETNVLLDSVAVATQGTKYFDHYWGGGQANQVKVRAPLLSDGDFKNRIVAAINKAKQSIAFSIYFFKQRDIEDALISANRRKVEIIGLIHTHRRFGMDDVRRTRATVERLREAGLTGLRLADPVRFTHSKYIVIDSEITFIGSGNWLDRDVTTHPQLYAELKDKRVGRALAAHLKAQLANR